jgi:hypothetical protein
MADVEIKSTPAQNDLEIHSQLREFCDYFQLSISTGCIVGPHIVEQVIVKVPVGGVVCGLEGVSTTFIVMSLWASPPPPPFCIIIAKHELWSAV